jgi:hypothetical protein
MSAVMQRIAVIVPVKVIPPLSVNVLFVGELGNTEQSGKLLFSMATVVGTTIVTVVAGDCGAGDCGTTVARTMNVSPKVVILNGSHLESNPAPVPVGVVYSIIWGC